MTVDSINAATVTAALEARLRDGLSNGETVTRSDTLNTDLDIATKGWVCVYRLSQSLPPRTTFTRRQLVQLVIVCQFASMYSGIDCEDSLELLIKRVMDILLSDTTISGTVINIDETIDIRYEAYEKQGDGFMQTAAIYFTGISNISVQ